MAKINKDAAAAIEDMIETKMKGQERRIARVAWGQGAVFAVFGAAVAVLVGIFADWLSHL